MTQLDTNVQETCDRCGVEVRPDSLFCYNCGAQVASAVPESNGDADRSLNLPGSRPVELRSAAAIRRSREPRQKRTFEVVWEPSNEEPGRIFIAATISCVLFVLIVLVLALYFK